MVACAAEVFSRGTTKGRFPSWRHVDGGELRLGAGHEDTRREREEPGTAHGGWAEQGACAELAD